MNGTLADAGEATLADACELAWAREALREAFERSEMGGGGGAGGGWGGADARWRERFERCTPSDVAAFLGEVRGLLSVVDEDAYVNAMCGGSDEGGGGRGRRM